MELNNSPESIYSPRIVILGGGGAAPQVAKGIAEAMPDAYIVVAQSGSDGLSTDDDKGGSSGKLRRRYDVAAPGDSVGAVTAFAGKDEAAMYKKTRFGADATIETVREHGDMAEVMIRAAQPNLDEAWLAMQLDSVDELAEDLLERDGTLKGHVYGNLHLTAQAVITGSMNEAIDNASTLLGLPENHVVMQTSDVPTNLRLHDMDTQGNEVILEGEGDIDEYAIQSPEKAWVEFTNDAPITPELDQEIREADIVLIGQGSWATSVLTALLAKGTVEAFANMKEASKVVALANLTEDGVSPSWDLPTFVEKLESYTNPDGQGRDVDGVLFQNDPDALPLGVKPILHDTDHIEHLSKLRVAIGGNFVSAEVADHGPNQLVAVRSKVLTNGRVVGEIIFKEFLSRQPNTESIEISQAA